MEDLKSVLEQKGYFAEKGLLMSIYLAMTMQRPLFLEGEPGVGKTEVAKVLSSIIGGELIRVQCYPGLESNEVLYEWNYLKQILNIRLRELKIKEGRESEIQDKELFTKEFLIPRPLLQAMKQDRPVVLLIDEIDRADERFEAFLLEYLSDFQISIPELGTISANKKPYIILTSNRTRDVHDALRRRCIYQWIDYPSIDKEMAIIRAKTPNLSENMVRQICAFVAVARNQPFDKKPGMSETLEWARVISELRFEQLFTDDLMNTFGCLLKTREDIKFARDSRERLFQEAQSLLSRLG